MVDESKAVREYAAAVAPELRMETAFRALQLAAEHCEVASAMIDPFDADNTQKNECVNRIARANARLLLATLLLRAHCCQPTQNDDPIIESDPAFAVRVDEANTVHINLIRRGNDNASDA